MMRHVLGISRPLVLLVLAALSSTKTFSHTYSILESRSRLNRSVKPKLFASQQQKLTVTMPVSSFLPIPRTFTTSSRPTARSTIAVGRERTQPLRRTAPAAAAVGRGRPSAVAAVAGLAEVAAADLQRAAVVLLPDSPEDDAQSSHGGSNSDSDDRPAAGGRSRGC